MSFRISSVFVYVCLYLSLLLIYIYKCLLVLHMCVLLYIDVCVMIVCLVLYVFTQLLPNSKKKKRYNVLFIEYNLFDFELQFSLTGYFYRGWRIKRVLVSSHSWTENRWIIAFPKVLVLSEAQTVPSRIQIRITDCICIDDKRLLLGGLIKEAE